jgi:hypothetical protein
MLITLDAAIVTWHHFHIAAPSFLRRCGSSTLDWPATTISQVSHCVRVKGEIGEWHLS